MKFNEGPSGGVLLLSVVVGFSVEMGFSVVLELIVVTSAETVELEYGVEFGSVVWGGRVDEF